jgi:hypothetical protein
VDKIVFFGAQSNVRSAIRALELADYPHQITLPTTKTQTHTCLEQRALPSHENQEVPIEFYEIRDRVNIFGRTQKGVPIIDEEPLMEMVCLNCSRRDYASDEAFHRHIIQCALND